jgi:hypothetical protein
LFGKSKPPVTKSLEVFFVEQLDLHNHGVVRSYKNDSEAI